MSATPSPDPAVSPPAVVAADASSTEARRGRFGALAYRDFRLIFLGQGISAMGSWVQLVAQGWLVYNLTGSSFYLGLVALARAIPVLLFSLVGGAVADRYDRRVILMAANGFVGVLAITLGILTWTGVVAVWHVVAISFLMGAGFSFEMPARQSLVSHVVEPKDVVNAVGLNSVAFNTSAVFGPALAALLINAVGEGSAFILNGLTFLVVILAAYSITPIRGAQPSRGSILANVVAGLGYVRRSPSLFPLLVMMALVSFLVRPYIQLLPVFARDVLQVGASGLGALNSAAGGGALVAAVLVATVGSYPRRGLVLALSCALFGVALVVFAASTSYTLSLGAAAALGFLSSLTGTTSNTMLQLHSDPRMRGRVISLHGLTMMGVVPIGAMFEGALGSVVGVPPVLIVGGALSVLVALGAAVLAPRLRSLE